MQLPDRGMAAEEVVEKPLGEGEVHEMEARLVPRPEPVAVRGSDEDKITLE